MFTGLVQGIGTVLRADDAVGMRRLRVGLGAAGSALAREISTGASIAINGTCLTVVSVTVADTGVSVDFDVMGETLERTNLGGLRVGDAVNVERSLKFGDEVGGHAVSGHVDCTACVALVEVAPNNRKVWFRLPGRAWSKYLVAKGFVVVDGVSLTVVDVREDTFSVCLIPETLARTTLGVGKEGDTVNVELDMQTKVTVETVLRLLPHMLREHLGSAQAPDASSS